MLSSQSTQPPWHSPLSAISFIICTSKKCAHNPFGMNTSKTQHLKPFRMKTYGKRWGEGGKLLTRNPTKDSCPERRTGARDLSADPMKAFYPERPSGGRDLSVHPTKDSWPACPVYPERRRESSGRGRRTGVRDLSAHPSKDFNPEPSTRIRLGGAEPRLLHRGVRFRILHKRLPHQTGPVILRHDHRDTQVNPQHILVVPAVKRIEGIDKTISPPGFFLVPAADIAKDAHAILIEKRKRAARGARHDAPVEGALRRRAAPSRVAFLVVGGADA